MLQQEIVECKVTQQNKQLVPVRFIGVENAEAIVGAPYRWCRDFAEQHGVKIHKNGRKFLIDADELFAAIEKHGGKTEAEAEPLSGVEALRIRLGLVRV